MKQIVLCHHKVYILNVQLESLQLQEFISNDLTET